MRSAVAAARAQWMVGPRHRGVRRRSLRAQLGASFAPSRSTGGSSPGWLLLSALVVWLMYALLIVAWRTMLAGWGQRLDGWTAARIWTVSSLGKYLPGQGLGGGGHGAHGAAGRHRPVGGDRVGRRAAGARHRHRRGRGRAHRAARHRGGASADRSRAGAARRRRGGGRGAAALAAGPPAAAPARGARRRARAGRRRPRASCSASSPTWSPGWGTACALWLLARGLLPAVGTRARRSPSRCSPRRTSRDSWRCSRRAASACGKGCSFSCCRDRSASAPRRRWPWPRACCSRITEFGAAVPFLVFPQGRARVAP